MLAISSEKMSIQLMPKIQCPKCEGKGRLELVAAYPALFDTLSYVVVVPGGTATEYLDGHVGVSVTAINNRLEDLRKLGWVRRERKGHSWRYWPIKNVRRKKQ